MLTLASCVFYGWANPAFVLLMLVSTVVDVYRGAAKAIRNFIFADPLTVQTHAGPLLIQPQRTNNILEQFFRNLKRAHRRHSGNASAGRMLRSVVGVEGEVVGAGDGDDQ